MTQRDESAAQRKIGPLRIVNQPAPIESGPGGESFQPDVPPVFGDSPKMRAIKAIVEQVADSSATILIRGESGVGKDLIARAVPRASARPTQPFVKVNCAALPSELLESELFGHEKGAFTGAYQKRAGKFEYANKGTLFLDEIGELPLSLQAKLLHVLQDREFYRIGGRELIRVDTRVIASTNRDLEAAVAGGLFRADLYYRLNVVEIHVPPLRERREEIPLLVEHLLQKFGEQAQRRVELPAEIMAAFMEYVWPGNIRELENIVRRLVVLANVPEVYQGILRTLRGAPTRPPAADNHTVSGSRGLAERGDRAGTPESSPAVDISQGLREIARQAAREAERKALKDVLDRVHWNRAEAARVLRVSYKTLLSKIDECGLE